MSNLIMSGPRAGPGASVAGEHFIIPARLFEGLTDGSSWSFVISRLSDVLNLPDLSTRQGLKKVHARFGEIYRKLDAAYNAGKYAGNNKIMGAVVGMMTKMCMDALLRDRLFEAGAYCVLEKITPLLNSDSTRHLALKALVMITHHVGEQARGEIARQFKEPLIELIQSRHDDHQTVEFALVTLSHATEAVMRPAPEAPREEPDIRSVLQIMVNELRKPSTCPTMITHAIDLFCSAPLYCPAQCEAVPGLLTVVTAFLRSGDIKLREQALSGLYRLLRDSECQPDVMYYDTQYLRAIAAFDPPPHLREPLRNYGPHRSDVNVTVDAIAAYTEVIMPALHDGNMYALGQRLGDLIERAEYVAGEGIWQTLEGLVCLPDDVADDDPAKRLLDSMPMAVKVLRAKAGKKDLDAADVVEMKFLVFHDQLPEANALANAAIKRNPRLAYAYFVISITTKDLKVALRAAKKGLKCPGITPFLRNQMLWHATNSAALYGWRVWRDAENRDMEARAEGLAFLSSAWADAETFISEAAPDSRYMLAVLNWYVLLTVLIRGPDLSEDLRELDSVRQKIQTTMNFMHYIRHPTAGRTRLDFARKLVLENFASGTKEWGALVRRFDKLNTCSCGRHQHDPRPSSSPTSDDLAEWLGNLSMEDGGHPSHAHQPCGDHVPGAAAPVRNAAINSYELHRCSWCRNPSAILKRCGGCGKTRYCDVACQKSHWAEHKSECKSGSR